MWEKLRYVMLSIPCIVDNRLMKLSQQNTQTCSLGIRIIISHLIFLLVSVPNGPLALNPTKEIQNKNKLVILYTDDVF